MFSIRHQPILPSDPAKMQRFVVTVFVLDFHAVEFRPIAGRKQITILELRMAPWRLLEIALNALPVSSVRTARLGFDSSNTPD